MTKPTALITGGAGFIGLHLARRLHQENFSITLLDNFTRGKEDSEFKQFLSLSKTALVECDLSSLACPRLPKSNFNYIFHLAAIVGVQNVTVDPYKVLVQNVASTINALEIAKDQSNLKRFVFSSTSEVYAGTLENFGVIFPTPENVPLCALDLKRPRSSYAMSKIYGENLCYHSGLPFTIVRPHNLYGPRMGLSHVIPELMCRSFFESKKPLDIFSPDHKRSFCYIDDAVEMLVRLGQSEISLNETFNVGNQDQEITIRDLAKLILTLTGRNGQIIEKPNTEGSPERRCPDMRKTTETIHFQAKIGLQEGLAKTFEWYRDNIFEKKELMTK